MNIYVAAAIDKVSPNAKDLLYRTVKEEVALLDVPATAFLPGKAFSLGKKHGTDEDEYLVNLNEMALHTSDCMLLCYAAGSESWGTPQELLLAFRWKIPVWVWTESRYEDMPIYLRSRIDPRRIFGVVHGALDDIAKHFEVKNGISRD